MAQAVGREGLIEDRAQLADAAGAWASTAQAYNGLISDLTTPTVEMGTLSSSMKT